MGHCNMLMKPSLSTYHELPWAGGSDNDNKGGYKVGEYFCNPYWIDENTPITAAPREVLSRQLKQLEQLGYDLYSSFEWEFRIADRDDKKIIQLGNDAESHLSFAEQEHILFDLESQLHKVGINVMTMEKEFGSSMFEFATKPVFGIDSADQSFLLKTGMKEMLQKRGYDCVFMAKPILHESGNGAHFNHSLWNKETKRGVLFNEEDKNKLSDVAKYWIAGLVKHLPSIAVLCAPTVNCYRRFHQPFAPHVADWGINDRTAALRVMNRGENGTYVENRIPSGSCNPYLVIAATIAAGIDGIKNKLELPSPMSKEATEFPHSLEEALQCLENDIPITNSLGTEFVEWFTKAKRDVEIKELKNSEISNDTDFKGLENEKQMYMKFC